MANREIAAGFKVTIITVVKNGEKVIQNLFDSVRRYKNANVEFVIVDGFSEDGTVEIIKKNEDIIDKWLSEPDSGIYDAMNKAVKLASGDWLIFMGADDELLDGFKQIIPRLKEKNAIYYGNVFFHRKVFTGKIKNNAMLTRTNICHQAIFYPLEVFKKYSYQTEYIKCADYVLNLKLWSDKAFKFVHRNFLIAIFEEGGFSSCVRDELFEKDQDKLFEVHLKSTGSYQYTTRGFLGALKQLVLFS